MGFPQCHCLRFVFGCKYIKDFPYIQQKRQNFLLPFQKKLDIRSACRRQAYKKIFNYHLKASFRWPLKISSSLLSDSNQRPRDYKSRALANWAKEAGGQLTVSRRYNQVPLLCSHPGGFRGSWPYRTARFFCGCKGTKKSEEWRVKSEEFASFLEYLTPQQVFAKVITKMWKTKDFRHILCQLRENDYFCTLKIISK